MTEYIKREAALKKQRWNGRLDEYVVFVSDIEDIPAADVVEMRHGKFEGRVFNTIWRIQSCSECREYVPQGNYCSNCGAKMDGGADDAAD